jgi:hypothetical protein
VPAAGQAQNDFVEADTTEANATKLMIPLFPLLSRATVPLMVALAGTFSLSAVPPSEPYTLKTTSLAFLKERWKRASSNLDHEDGFRCKEVLNKED